MAIKPAINPGVAVAERPATLSGAMNFISGGQTLGSSVVASAANKIVGFQRGAAAVAPKAPDLGSIIKTLSTNILSNVENKLQNINQEVKQVIQNKFISQLGEYREKLKETTDNPPNKILQNFLSLYKEAIGYIQFLGNRKNIKRLGDNLQALQNVFTETFRVAALIRTTINKIVSQLSNLPTASGGPGGLNLDIDVPGGPLKRGLPSKKNLLKMAGMGAAVAGAGALGSKVVSGMMDVGGEVQPDTTGVSASIPTPLLDRFMEVLNRFDKALQNFQAPQKAPSAPSAPTGGAKTTDKSGGGAVPPGGGGATDVTADTQEEKAWLQTIRQVEGTADKGGYNKLVGGEVVPELTQMTLQEVYDLGMKSRIGEGTLPQRFGGRKVKFGADSHAMGAYQFKPQTMMGVAKQLGFDPKTTLFSPEIQDKLGLKNLRGTGVDPTKRATKADIEKAGTQWAGLTPYYGQTRRTASKSLEIYNKYYGTQATGGPGEDVAKLEAQIRASTDKSQTMKGLAGDVSQPAVKIDQNTDVTVVPVVLGGAQASATASGSPMAAPPIMSNGGATVPFLPSTNEDNFFTMLSKVVYNIVDG